MPAEHHQTGAGTGGTKHGIRGSALAVPPIDTGLTDRKSAVTRLEAQYGTKFSRQSLHGLTTGSMLFYEPDCVRKNGKEYFAVEARLGALIQKKLMINDPLRKANKSGEHRPAFGGGEKSRKTVAAPNSSPHPRQHSLTRANIQHLVDSLKIPTMSSSQITQVLCALWGITSSSNSSIREIVEKITSRTPCSLHPKFWEFADRTSNIADNVLENLYQIRSGVFTVQLDIPARIISKEPELEEYLLEKEWMAERRREAAAESETSPTASPVGSRVESRTGSRGGSPVGSSASPTAASPTGGGLSGVAGSSSGAAGTWAGEGGQERGGAFVFDPSGTAGFVGGGVGRPAGGLPPGRVGSPPYRTDWSPPRGRGGQWSPRPRGGGDQSARGGEVWSPARREDTSPLRLGLHLYGGNAGHEQEHAGHAVLDLGSKNFCTQTHSGHPRGHPRGHDEDPFPLEHWMDGGIEGGAYRKNEDDQEVLDGEQMRHIFGDPDKMYAPQYRF